MFRILQKWFQVWWKRLPVSEAQSWQILVHYYYYFTLFVSCDAVATPARLCSRCSSKVAVGSCLPSPAPASCTLTPVPIFWLHYSTLSAQRCGLSLIITSLILHCHACISGLIWMGGRGRASRKATHPCLWFQQGQTNRWALIGDLQQKKQELSAGAGRLFPVGAHERAWAPAVFKTTRGKEICELCSFDTQRKSKPTGNQILTKIVVVEWDSSSQVGTHFIQIHRKVEKAP